MEAEWEYAARGGQRSEEHLYSGSNNADEVAWYIENSGKQADRFSFRGGYTHKVGQKKPNELGLYDMSGNVHEWCIDRWHDNYRNAPADGSAWMSNVDAGPKGHLPHGHVFRGGAWYSPSWQCRCSARTAMPVKTPNFYGFRIVLAPSERATLSSVEL